MRASSIDFSFFSSYIQVMIKYLLTVFLSLPLLWAGSLETIISIQFLDQSFAPDKAFSSNYNGDIPLDILETRMEENEENEEEEEEALRLSCNSAVLIFSMFELPFLAPHKILIVLNESYRSQNRTYPCNKAPPLSIS